MIPFPPSKAALGTPVFVPQALLPAKGLFRDGLNVPSLPSLTDSFSLIPASCCWSAQPHPFTSHPVPRSLWGQPELLPGSPEEPQSPGRGGSGSPYHQGTVLQDLNTVGRPGCWYRGPSTVPDCRRQDDGLGSILELLSGGAARSRAGDKAVMVDQGPARKQEQR